MSPTLNVRQKCRVLVCIHSLNHSQTLQCTRPHKLSKNRPHWAEKNEAPLPAAFTQGGRLLSSHRSQLGSESLQFLHHERIQVALGEHRHGQPEGFVGKEDRRV